MDLISPTRTTTTLQRGNCIAFLVSFAIVLAGLTSSVRTPIWVVVMSMACLAFGWLLTATLITHITSDLGPICEPPDIQAEFRAMSQIPLTLRLLNPSDRSSLLFLTAEVLVECEGHLLQSPPKFIGQLPQQNAAEFNWRLTPRQRGEYALRGMLVRTAFPGSILTREFAFTFDRTLLALPARLQLTPQASRMLSGRKRASGRQPLHPAGMEEFVGVRQYRAGDNPRHVSLALSLRMPDYPMQLAVREFEDPSDDEICVVLDTAVPPPDADDWALIAYRYEKSICFAIALCRQLCELKHQVRFVACQEGEHPFQLRINHAARDIPILERKLSRLKPTPDPERVRRLLEWQARRSDAILLYVSLQDSPEPQLRASEKPLCLNPEWQQSLVAEAAS